MGGSKMSKTEYGLTPSNLCSRGGGGGGGGLTLRICVHGGGGGGGGGEVYIEPDILFTVQNEIM